jgi:GxxExxY protein
MAALEHREITDLLIKAFFRVYNTLGHGFLEKVYENAMAIEARRLGLCLQQQMRIQVLYGEAVVGDYSADLVANNAVIVELKVADTLAPAHEAQLLNYLKATPFEVGLLMNFGVKPEFRRRIMDNSRKGNLSWYQSRMAADSHGLDPCASAKIRG